MKNNKILISEISRIKTLMGSNLILEQFTNVIEDVIKYAGKLTGKLSDNTERMISKLSKVATEEETVKLLADIANQSDEMAQIILPKIMSTISPAESKKIAEFKTLLYDEGISQGLDVGTAKASAEDWVNKNIITDFEGVKDIVKKDLLDYLDNIVKKQAPTPKPKPIPNPEVKPKSVTDVAGQTWENITPLSANELKKLEKLYRAKGLGKSFFKSMRMFAQNVVNMMTSQYKLMDETLSLIKSMDTVTNAAQLFDISKKIGDNIQELTNRDLTNYGIINKWIEINVLDYKLKLELKGLDGYTKAAKIFDGGALKTWKENYKVFSDRRKALLKQFNSVFNPFSWFGKPMKKWADNGPNSAIWNKMSAIFKGDEFGELRRYIATGQTQKWSGIKKFKQEFGLLPTMGNVAKEQVWNYISLSLLLGFVDYVTDLIGNGLRDVPYLNEIGKVQKQINSYDEHISDKKEDVPNIIEPIVNSSQATKGLYHFFKDWFGDYTVDEFKDIAVVFPGLWDNFFDFWEFFRGSKISKEDAENVVKKGEELKPKIKTELDKIESEISKTPKNTNQQTPTVTPKGKGWD